MVDSPASADVCPAGLPRWVPRRAGARLSWSLLAGAATHALAHHTTGRTAGARSRLPRRAHTVHSTPAGRNSQ